MIIALAKDVEEFLEGQLRSGACADPSDLVNDVLRCVREQQQRPFEITPDLEAWLLEAAEKATTPLNSDDFNSIRQRARTPSIGS
jgi:Arc/MetJ-type ribon-helix-helix transcriptional regulator